MPLGSSIPGVAAAERRVRWTGDYLADQTFPHDALDERIVAQSIRSMISAPLIGTDRLLGTLTVEAMDGRRVARISVAPVVRGTPAPVRGSTA